MNLRRQLHPFVPDVRQNASRATTDTAEDRAASGALKGPFSHASSQNSRLINCPAIACQPDRSGESRKVREYGARYGPAHPTRLRASRQPPAVQVKTA